MRFRFTRHFEVTLDDALDFLLDNDAPEATLRLADVVVEHLPDILCRHPRIGRDFMARQPCTEQAQALHARVRTLLGDDIELREYIMGDYLVLYAIHDQCISALAIRHHRQARFDFAGDEHA